MDSILHYTSVSHAGSLMAGINRLRITADLCDVTVVVGDYRILAHKIILSASSPFFYQVGYCLEIGNVVLLGRFISLVFTEKQKVLLTLKLYLLLTCYVLTDPTDKGALTINWFFFLFHDYSNKCTRFICLYTHFSNIYI